METIFAEEVVSEMAGPAVAGGGWANEEEGRTEDEERNGSLHFLA